MNGNSLFSDLQKCLYVVTIRDYRAKLFSCSTKLLKPKSWYLACYFLNPHCCLPCTVLRVSRVGCWHSEEAIGAVFFPVQLHAVTWVNERGSPQSAERLARGLCDRTSFKALVVTLPWQGKLACDLRVAKTNTGIWHCFEPRIFLWIFNLHLWVSELTQDFCRSFFLLVQTVPKLSELFSLL